jgi:hypothetical protein
MYFSEGSFKMNSDEKLIRVIKKLYEWQYEERVESDFTHQLLSSLQKANDSELT